MTETRKTAYTKWIKPLLDRCLGFLGLLCLSWLYLILAAAIYLDDPGPILFRQKRVGIRKNGQLSYFQILKFRTMRVDTPHDTPTHLLSDPDHWTTRVGKLLRKSSLVRMAESLKSL